MTDYLTFKELATIEKAASAGDKEAQEKLNRMARDEGYSDYISLNVALVKKSLPIWEAQRKQHKKYTEWRDKISNIKPVIAYFDRLEKSQNPLDRANYKTALHSQIFTMAKALDNELMSMAQDPRPVEAGQDDGEAGQDNSDIQTKNKFAYLWIKRGWVRMKGYDMTRWLHENDAPQWLTPMELNRHMQKMYKKNLIDKVGREYRPRKK